jgi:DNA-binding transcriptional MerR regulator
MKNEQHLSASYAQHKTKLTRQEAADRLRVHPDTVDRWAEAGLLRPMRYPSPNGGRSTIRYSLTEIERFEREAQSR